ncbi:hypothetical protein F5Y04DRAFT_289461 [Hypomontagnella monticulosa]|nr:hypothetical protein F5Y04DRAFT_289461 [Hypomontagnella monticulosa]
MDNDFLDISLFSGARNQWHSDHRKDEGPKLDRFGLGHSTRPQRWEEWVVKLSFNKLGIRKEGSGFFVNIPNTRFDVIFTAAHNLVEKPQKYCSNIKIVTGPSVKGEIPVTTDMIRVRQEYLERPDELNAVHDYGIILLDRGQKKERRGFAFHLMLGLSDKCIAGLGYGEGIIRGRWVYVGGYKPGETEFPRRSDGICTREMLTQLTYKANTEPGMSGGPVWMGFRGVETVVGIHNYGAKSGQDNRGTRLGFNAWRTIFGWLGVGSYGKSLHYRGFLGYSVHLHLEDPSVPGNANPSEGLVRVGKPGQVDTLFDILPITWQPETKESNALFGFMLQPKGADASSVYAMPSWVRWDPEKNMVSCSQLFDKRCEVKITPLISQAGKPFAIQVPLGNEFKQVRMEMEYLDEAEREELDADDGLVMDTPEISFVPVNAKKLFELKEPPTTTKPPPLPLANRDQDELSLD